MGNYLASAKKYFNQSSGSWQILSIICISISSFAAAVVLSHLFTPAEYGVYRYILAWTVLSSFFTLSGANFAVTQATLDGAEGTLFSVIKTRLAFGLFGALFFGVVSAYYYLNGNSELGLLFALYSPFVALSEGLTSHLGYFVGKKQLRTNFLFEVSANIAGTFFVITTVLLHGTVVAALLVNFLVTFLVRVFGTLYVLRKISRTARRENVLVYSAKLTLFSAFEVATQFVDKVIVFHFLGAHGLAFYVFTIIFVDQLRELFRMVIWKNIILDKEHLLPFRVGKLPLTVIAYSLLLAVLYALAAPFLYQFFFPKYVSVVTASTVYALSFFTAYMYIPMYRYQQDRKTKRYGLHQLLVLFLTVLFISLGSLYFGLMGAVIGALFSKIMAALSSVFMYETFEKKF